MATIFEVLQNANTNLCAIPDHAETLPIFLAKEQLHGVIQILELGYGPDTDIEELISEYGSIENIPPYEREQCNP